LDFVSLLAEPFDLLSLFTVSVFDSVLVAESLDEEEESVFGFSDSAAFLYDSLR